MKKIFQLEKIMTVSTTIWFIVGGLIIIIGYFGIKIYLGDHLKYFSNSLIALSVATGIMMSGFYYLRKSFQKEEVIIEIIDKKDIVIYYDDKLKISCPISDMVKMYAIHPANKKSSVQAEIIFKNGKVDLYSEMNFENKQAFDNFINYLEKEFGFTHKKAPFSLRYSKHYVEYINPLYRK